MTSVEYQVAQIRPVALTEEAVGTLQPQVVTTLSSKVMGNVLEVLKREGDVVTAGEVVVRIDAKDIGSDLVGAQAVLSEAGAAGTEVEQHLASAESAKASALAQEKLARDSFARIEAMLARKSVTQQEADNARAALTQAEQAVRQADSQIAALRAKRAQVEARVRQARAQLGKVSTIKELAEVRAPFTGRVTSRRVEPGMLAAPGVPLLVIEEAGRILCEAIVPERLLGRVPEGATLSVQIDAVPGPEFPGTVVEIVPSADRLSHTFLVKISIENDPRLRSGMFARALVPLDEAPLLLIPTAAVELRGQLEGVYVEVDGRPRYRLVRTGRRFGAEIEILAGLVAGERFAATAPAAAAAVQTGSAQPRP
jgi:multidrug resistance efflux pump